MALLVLTAIAIFLISPKPQQPVGISKRESDYAIASRLSFNSGDRNLRCKPTYKL
jgi:hypothetical protein